MIWLTAHQLGIILVVLGTILLAFSLKVTPQYTCDAARAVDQLKKDRPDLIELTETYIIRWRFWTGLALVALGSLLQW